MNSKTPFSNPTSMQNESPRIEPSIVPIPSGYMDNLRYRERETGVGYGSSSGYARNRRYAERSDRALFRCA